MSKKRSRKAPDGPELPLEPPSEAPPEGDGPESRSPWGGRRRSPALFEFDDPSPGQSAAKRAGPPENQEADESGEEEEPAAETTSSKPGSKARRGSGSTELDSMFEEAKAASTAGRFEEAVGVYRRIVSADPGHVRARNNLGVLLDQMGSHKAALEHFQAAVDMEPENPELLTNFGAALAAQGHYEEAEAQLRKAVRMDPGGVDVRANLGILYFRRGLYAQSDHELRWVCDQDPDHALAHFYRGEALNRLGRVDDALETLERAAHLQPEKARIYYLLGILYDKKNLPQEAGMMYRKARKLADQ